MAEAEAPATVSIIVISDFVCPWCYVGLMEVDKLRQQYEFEVHFEPFLLRPETPPEGMPARRIVEPDAPRTDLEMRGEGLGINFKRGRTITSNSHLALEAAEFAGEYGDAWRFHRRMFRAYFEDLEDIGDLETVVRIGIDAGLHGDSLRVALEERRYRDRVDEGIEWSRAIGVTAVPTFVFNERFGMVGAQEQDAFRQMMEKIGHRPRA